MTLETGIVFPEAQLVEICRRYQVRELAVFGSVARGEERPDSDVDLLVDFLPDARPGLLGVSAMTREFAAVLGRRVDVAVKPAPALKALIRPGILAEAKVVYAA
ncbi:MAG TPA: nucleotidyltransferase family protein [Bryobacteraceae bacterium]|nr:nucleotidyltransferase family protein [Bryobacteraceae bacterium]